MESNIFLFITIACLTLSGCSKFTTLPSGKTEEYNREKFLATSDALIEKDKLKKIDKNNSQLYFQFLNAKFPNSWSARGLHVFDGYEFDFWRGELRTDFFVSELVNCTDSKYYCLKSDIMNVSIPRKCSDLNQKGWKHAGNEMVVISYKKSAMSYNEASVGGYIIYEKSKPEIIFSYRTGINAIMSREFGNADLVKHFSQKKGIDFDTAVESWSGPGTAISRLMSSEAMGACEL